MKNLLSILFLSLLNYLFASFIMWDLDISHWSGWVRVLYLVLTTWEASVFLDKKYEKE